MIGINNDRIHFIQLNCLILLFLCPMTRHFFSFFAVDFRCYVAEEKPAWSGEGGRAGGERLKAEG
jgi:hypothetical protein